MGLRELLIPKDKIFFDLFEKQAGVNSKMSSYK